MAYQLRLYAPTGAGITSITVQNSSGTLLGRVTPARTETACFNQSGLTIGVTITPSLEDGVTVSTWVVNVDGSVYYQYTDTCTIEYDSTASNIQVSLEVEGTPTTTYYANLILNANGGTDAPSTLYAMETQSNSGYVWIYSNGWKKYIPWIYSNGWSKYIPWVYSNGWKRGS